MAMKTGEVVYEAGPYWKVVRVAPRRFVVVDTSVTPPQRVSETEMPRDKAEAEARELALLWGTVTGQFL